jgi:molybdopterin/thiamine biosynthesis adenylyltransferase
MRKMMLPRIKPILTPVRLSAGRIRIGTLYGVGAEVQDDEEGTIWRLLGLMNGTRSTETIVSEMWQAVPALEEQSIYEAIDTLIDQGFVEDAVILPPAELSDTELEQYSRNINYFSRVDMQPRPSPYEHQLCLKHARVTVLGLGGSGSAMAMSLAAVGVGSLHLGDFDPVEVSNLNRQLLYTVEDVGRPKVAAAVDRLRQLNSHITITGQELQVTSSDDLMPLMQGRDLFILCADTPPVQLQLWVNDAALRTQTPWLINSYSGPVLGVGIFVPFTTPCYQCLNHEEERQRTERNENVLEYLFDPQTVQAVIAPTASLTGHLGALEAIYFLTGLQPQTLGRVFHQDLTKYDNCFYTEVPFWAECPCCGVDSPYRQATIRSNLQDNGRTQ